MRHIAILDDDERYAQGLQGQLSARDCSVRVYTCPEALFEACSQLRPSLFLIDWFMPKTSGALVLQRLRRSFGNQTPVIVVTGACCETTELKAFSLGADDVVSKPVNCALLLARIDAVLRRGRTDVSRTEVAVGAVRLDLHRRHAVIGTQQVALTPKEFELALVLFRNPQTFLSRKTLASTVWGATDDSKAMTLAQHVSALRKKLQLGAYGIRLSSVYGVGYRLDVALGPDVAPAVPRPDAERLPLD